MGAPIASSSTLPHEHEAAASFFGGPGGDSLIVAAVVLAQPGVPDVCRGGRQAGYQRHDALAKFTEQRVTNYSREHQSGETESPEDEDQRVPVPAATEYETADARRKDEEDQKPMKHLVGETTGGQNGKQDDGQRAQQTMRYTETGHGDSDTIEVLLLLVTRHVVLAPISNSTLLSLVAA